MLQVLIVVGGMGRIECGRWCFDGIFFSGLMELPLFCTEIVLGMTLRLCDLSMCVILRRLGALGTVCDSFGFEIWVFGARGREEKAFSLSEGGLGSLGAL